MQKSHIDPLMLHQHSASLFSDLGQHTLEVTDQGGMLIVEHAAREVPFKESVHLDQDETYRLFLVLQAWFTTNGIDGNAQYQERPVESGEAC